MTRTATGWFTSMQSGNLSANERAQFIEWLAQSAQHVEDYLAVAAVWRSLDQTAAARLSATELLAAAAAEADAQNVVPLIRGSASEAGTRHFHVNRRMRFGGIAAALGVAALGVGAWLTADQWLNGRRYSTQIGEQVSFSLPDGSTVRLNTQSTVRVHLRDSERRITLIEGEALFEVAKDATRPFRVRSGGTVVEALGTVFNVHRMSAQTSVTVLEGRVRVSAADDLPLQARAGAASAELAARETAHVLGKGNIVTEHDVSVERVTAWTDRRLIFHTESLAAVVTEFNRYNRRQLQIMDPQLATLQISGNFNATDPGSLIEFLQRLEEVEASEDGAGFVQLSRKK